MSGLLRRFRRGKPKEEEEADTPDTPEEVRESDADIYPHRAPERPKRRDDRPSEDEPPAVEEEGGDVVAPPAELPEEIGPAPETHEPRVGPAPLAPPVSETAPLAETRPDVPSPAPPRLPEAADGGSRSAHRPLTAPGHCFLCGAELSGAFCPVCRMTWNE
ncbi:MAG: hypothetical protein L3K00_04320 [Thermoplasmata archaeon]|nr:hypothetical protein [Thermoplasmata archaeon]MCI4361846.1 hypothetical protein [Thermoplasmata archaeon]